MCVLILFASIGPLATEEKPSPAATPAAGNFPSLEALQKEVSRLVEATRPSVVGVVARSSVEALLRPMGPDLKITPAPTPRARMIRRVGSGLVLDDLGNVATLVSVVGGADEVTVVPADGRRLRASIRGMDGVSGLAVLHINVDTPLPAVDFAELADLQVGAVVTTLGISQESAPVFSLGFVSGKGVSHGPVRRSPYLKLDAWSSPGAAGGAVLDSKGQLVGMLFGADEPRERANDLLRWHHQGGSVWHGTPGAEDPEAAEPPDQAVPPGLAALRRPGSTGSAVSYALPAKLVQHVTREIIASGQVRRGWMGVTVDDRGSGEIVLAEVIAGSPADHAGLVSGDRVVIVNGQPVKGSSTLMESLASADPGESLRLIVVRDGKRVPAQVQLGTAPAPQFSYSFTGVQPRRRTLGVRVEQPEPEDLKNLGAPGGGMLIAEVHEESRAEKAGLVEGDLIVRAMGRPVRDLSDLRSALRAQPAGQAMEMVVVRNHREVSVSIPPPPDLPDVPDAPTPPQAPRSPQPRRPPRP